MPETNMTPEHPSTYVPYKEDVEAQERRAVSKLVAALDAWDGYIEVSDEQYREAERLKDELGCDLWQAINVVLDFGEANDAGKEQT